MKTHNVNYYEASQDFVPENTGWKRICQLIRAELLPNKKNWLGTIVSFLGGFIIAWIIGTADGTVEMTNAACTVFLELQIAVFGCVLTAYSILLAFLDEKYMKILLHIGYKGKPNYLKAGTDYFEAVMYIYVVGIMVSLCTKLVVTCMPINFLVSDCTMLNESVAVVLLFVYLSFCIRTIYEIKSIVANTATLFGGSLAFRIQKFATEIDEE